MNYLYKAAHPDQPDMFAAIVLASRPTNGAKPLITLHGRYPRIIHGEIMTHRQFSRNARSSRAVPVKTMLNEVRTKPFVPWHWGANQSGMQAGEDCNELLGDPSSDWEGIGLTQITREEGWLKARDFNAEMAEAYMNAGYHKQIPNRFLEPFSWMDTLISATNWANFLHLRDHKDAEPHFQDWARLVKEAMTWLNDNDAYEELDHGQWHLPYITKNDRDYACLDMGLGVGEAANNVLRKISAARCARISYKPFDGDGSIERELARYDQLISSDRLHASPTEHQATLDEGITNGDVVPWMNSRLAGNLDPGWIQFRKTLAGEYIED